MPCIGDPVRRALRSSHMAGRTDSPQARIAGRRRVAAAVLGALLLAVVVIAVSCSDDSARDTASAYAADWERQDFQAMYNRLSPQARSSMSLDRFVEIQRNALALATVRKLKAGKASDPEGGVVTVPFTVDTRIFGTLKLDARIRVSGEGENAAVNWDPSLALPGLKAGESPSRATTMPPRASILAADGTPLAEGPERSSPIPSVAAEITGKVGSAPAGSEVTYMAYGYPAGVKVGLSGLERIFQTQLAGRPGGVLKAGNRVIARSVELPARPVRTTIVPSIERAAASALAGRYGGIAAVDPSTGAVLALAGVAFSETGPPGSTFKIITATAALETGVARLDSTYPYATAVNLDGRSVSNANGENCGGTLVQSFADSCNSVFAPLGIKVGARKLVSTAEAYGFNRPMPGIPNAAISTIPKASELRGEEVIGTSAFGQGQVEASPLEMTTVAATIANAGVRMQPTLVLAPRAKGSRVTSARVAKWIRTMMLAVVRNGTGSSAQISGVPVAGKTGTAELRDPDSPGYVAGDPSNTDAWFVSFAPAYSPRIAVGVLINGGGAGGDTAAPAAREVLVAGLSATRGR